MNKNLRKDRIRWRPSSVVVAVVIDYHPHSPAYEESTHEKLTAEAVVRSKIYLQPNILERMGLPREGLQNPVRDGR